jgi:hypothetical protein
VTGATTTAMERTWSFRGQATVVDAVKFAELATSYCDERAREAAAMAVAELAENVVKYGVPGDRKSAASIAIGVERKTVRIRVKNATKSPTDAASVMAMVAKISTSPSVSDLYRERLRELFQNPKLPRAQLGLIRIAFEGGFRLSCNYEAPVLEIVAERPCDEAE